MSRPAAGAVPAGTPEWVVTHARAQQRHFRWCEWAHRFLPRLLHPSAAALIANQFSPEQAQAAKIWRGLAQFTGASDAEVHRLVARWFANQGQFAIALHDYPRLDPRWARDEVDCDRRDLLAELTRRGGLVLTYHSQHHNRSGAFFGLSGTCVWGIAATEVNSLWRPWTARWVRLVNGGSEAHFGGGTYLFTDELRTLLTKSREGLQRGQTVVTLCDNDSDSASAARVNVAGRALRVATGMIELAQELGVPITFALFHGDLAGGYRCRLAHPPADAVTPAAIAQAYMDQLLAWCRSDPWAWQGWMWWDDLPAFDAGAELAPQRAALDARREASRPAPRWPARVLARVGEWQVRLSPPVP